MVRLHQEGELSDDELIDLKGFVNTIITHITNGNKNEERLVNIMGGTVIETESEKLIRQGMSQGRCEGEAKMLVELGQEYGLDETAILKRMQEKTRGLFLHKKAFYYLTSNFKNIYNLLIMVFYALIRKEKITFLFWIITHGRLPVLKDIQPPSLKSAGNRITARGMVFLS